jgi:hypothetical protein
MTLVLPYFSNPGMLREQQRVWRSYAEGIRAALHVIVVDDCSPLKRRAVLEDTGLASVRLYRALEKKRWNWLFCRNLGVHQAATPWVLMTDIDHVVPEATWRAVMTEPLTPACVYRFARVDAPTMTVVKSHPNSWLMTTGMYERVGGYDERLSGYYGTDADFRDRVQTRARAIVVRTDTLIRYPASVIPDAETTVYGRKERQDNDGLAEAKADRDRISKWRPLRLTIPWERVA